MRLLKATDTVTGLKEATDVVSANAMDIVSATTVGEVLIVTILSANMTANLMVHTVPVYMAGQEPIAKHVAKAGQVTTVTTSCASTGPATAPTVPATAAGRRPIVITLFVTMGCPTISSVSANQGTQGSTVMVCCIIYTYVSIYYIYVLEVI